MDHPTPQQLASYLDGEIAGRRHERLQEHVGACPACQTSLAQLHAIREAIWSTAPQTPCLNQVTTFMTTLERRLRRDRPSGWRSVCFAAPFALALAGLAAHCAEWVIVSGDLLQQVGIVPQIAPQVSAWAVETATAPIWQRMVYEPLGWSQQEVSSAVSQIMSPVQNDALRPLWTGLLMALPLTLLFGVGVLALSWFICWTGPSQRK